MSAKPNLHGRMAGALIVAAALELVISVIIAQHIYPGYSLSNNYISDLGVGATAAIFNTSMQAFGALLILAAYLLYGTGSHKYVALAFAVAAVGGIGVGTFPETTGLPHIISATVVFGTVTVMALGFFRVFRGRLAGYSLAAGMLGAVVFVLFALSLAGVRLSLGIGAGGVEEILLRRTGVGDGSRDWFRRGPHMTPRTRQGGACRQRSVINGVWG